jgi:hypothetical protein
MTTATSALPDNEGEAAIVSPPVPQIHRRSNVNEHPFGRPAQMSTTKGFARTYDASVNRPVRARQAREL